MSEEKNIKNEKVADQVPVLEKKKKGRSFFGIILLLFRIVALVGFAVAAYLVFQDLHQKEEARVRAETRANLASAELKAMKESNIAKPSSTSEDKQNIVPVLKNNKDYEFLQKSLVQTQGQLEDLKANFHYLDEELIKVRNSNNLGRIILSYVNLREEIFFNSEDGIGSYLDSLKNFEILSGVNNKDLRKDIEALKVLLPRLKSQKELSAQFDALIPDLVVAKRVGTKDDLASKIRQNLSKMIIIRKIDDKGSLEEIDGIISRTERLLRRQDYRGALNRLRSLDPVYMSILSDFVTDLEVALKIKKIDNDILSYLKNLS